MAAHLDPAVAAHLDPAVAALMNLSSTSFSSFAAPESLQFSLDGSDDTHDTAPLPSSTTSSIKDVAMVAAPLSLKVNPVYTTKSEYCTDTALKCDAQHLWVDMDKQAQPTADQQLIDQCSVAEMCMHVLFVVFKQIKEKGYDQQLCEMLEIENETAWTPGLLPALKQHLYLKRPADVVPTFATDLATACDLLQLADKTMRCMTSLFLSSMFQYSGILKCIRDCIDKCHVFRIRERVRFELDTVK